MSADDGFVLVRTIKAKANPPDKVFELWYYIGETKARSVGSSRDLEQLLFDNADKINDTEYGLHSIGTAMR